MCFGPALLLLMGESVATDFVGVPTDFLGGAADSTAVKLNGIPLKKGFSSWLKEAVLVRTVAFLTVADWATLPDTGFVLLLDLGSALFDPDLLLCDWTELEESDFLTTGDPDVVLLAEGFWRPDDLVLLPEDLLPLLVVLSLSLSLSLLPPLRAARLCILFLVRVRGESVAVTGFITISLSSSGGPPRIREDPLYTVLSRVSVVFLSLVNVLSLSLVNVLSSTSLLEVVLTDRPEYLGEEDALAFVERVDIFCTTSSSSGFGVLHLLDWASYRPIR